MLRNIALVAAGLIVLSLLALAMMPWGAFKGRAERALSDRIGAPVTIGSIVRQNAFSFAPVLELRDIRVAQPGWAGRGDLLRVARLEVRLPVLPMLIGRVRPEPVAVDNGRAVLIRARDGRKNWSREGRGDGGAGSGLERLAVRDLAIDYRDFRKDRHLVVRVDSDAKGFRVAGAGRLGDEPVKLALTGDPVAGRKAWPFTASIAGPRTVIRIRGVMARPLDSRHMRFDIAARGADLLDIDRVIEAGLFGTQPVRLEGAIARDGDIWKIERLKGTVGRSRLSSAVATIDKTRPGRTGIDGAIRLAMLDFADLANTRGRALAAAKRAQHGPRLIPDTRIDLRNVDDVDGVLRVTADRLVATPDDGFRTLSGTLKLEDSRLRLEPFAMGMARGTLGGRVVVDQRGGRAKPLLSVDLKLSGASIGALAGGGAIDAPLDGIARLTGTGETIREAVGRSTGTVALVSGAGRIPANVASYLGLDVGRGALVDKDRVASLRCLIVRMDVAGGNARMNPLLIDTSRSQSQVTGTIDLSAERLALSLTGSPKKESLLRLTKAAAVTGTIKAPKLSLPDGAKPNVGGVLKLLGDAIAGERPPLARDADCRNLAARAMR